MYKYIHLIFWIIKCNQSFEEFCEKGSGNFHKNCHQNVGVVFRLKKKNIANQKWYSWDIRNESDEKK